MIIISKYFLSLIIILGTWGKLLKLSSIELALGIYFSKSVGEGAVDTAKGSPLYGFSRNPQPPGMSSHLCSSENASKSLTL